MSLDRPPRVAVAGVRRVRRGVGQFLARQLAAHGAAVPAFLASRPETIAEGQALLASHGIAARGFASLSELLAAEPVDALVVATPDPTHLALLEGALDAKLHVLCEKPLVWGVPNPADHAARVAQRFHAAGLVLRENCPWPYTIPAYRALHPGVLDAPVRDFAMWLSPSEGGPSMLIDAISHPISLLQELTGADEAAVEGLSFSTRDLPAGRLELAFRFLAGPARVAALVRLHAVPDQPRPAGYAVNGVPAERRIRMPDYAQSFEEGGRSVPLPDPMSALVGRFVAALVKGEREPEARRERRRIVSRMRIVSEMSAALARALRT